MPPKPDVVWKPTDEVHRPPRLSDDAVDRLEKLDLLPVLSVPTRYAVALKTRQPLVGPRAVQITIDETATGGQRDPIPRKRYEFTPEFAPSPFELLEHPLQREHTCGLVAVDASDADERGARSLSANAAEDTLIHGGRFPRGHNGAGRAGRGHRVTLRAVSKYSTRTCWLASKW